ncbi:MAG: SAM-dependent methyltransferase [Defluviitaleaceae bacterium]|nr:SAM-dependent methyltransferase [Defluviitaleaceae bacterium]
MVKYKTSEDNVTIEIGKYLKETKLNYTLQREIQNRAISDSLMNNPSKSGGSGGGIPDAFFTITHENETWFGFIENKSGKSNMSKFDKDGFIANHKKDGNLNHQTIGKFAVNGAAYYAKNAFKDTEYKHYFVIGACGYEEYSQYMVDVDVYIITPETGGEPLKYKSFTNLSFLNPENIDATIKEVEKVHLTPEQQDILRSNSEASVDSALTDLNQKMRDDFDIDAKWRINIIVAMILAGLGDKNNRVAPLKIEQLTGSIENDNTDADIILRKIRNLLEIKSLPLAKREQIAGEIERTIKYNNEGINQISTSGETVLRTLFREIKDKILPFVENKMLDFAGTVYNKVTDWMPLADDEANDVVLTPRYVIDFMVKLARVDRNSYVWDFALGSGGFLISSMNAMLKDAKENITNPDKLRNKEKHIKEKQLLGIEKRSDVQMLAILNMFLVGDGSSNILNKDSLANFNGNYAYPNDTEKFPANVFLLNPPYSADGNGMVFVHRALSMMKPGYAAVIIQDSAGSGKATAYNTDILKESTLIASIKMPVDIFGGKSSVQTSIYVFQVGQKHNVDQIVKFIDFRDDGYKRANRRKADKSVNLRNVNNATERYEEVVKYVVYGNKPTLLDYEESKINPADGNDWNFEKHKNIDTKPTEADFRKTVADYLAWEVSQVIKDENFEVNAPKK